ncbi:MAG: VOC family protein [Candidatus Eremiobacteraeota bacterium]|nr:VOC family protein [Candidatus Eremiobacteraeota bacterium]
MELNPNLVFNGNAEEALNHYRAALGGELQVMRYADSPASEQTSPDWANKVIFGSLRSPAGTLNIMDAPPERAGEPGDNFMLSVNTETAEQTDSIFAKLLEGGSVVMPLERTFWSPRFGMLTDKFGIKWMVNLSQGTAQ